MARRNDGSSTLLRMEGFSYAVPSRSSDCLFVLQNTKLRQTMLVIVIVVVSIVCLVMIVLVARGKGHHHHDDDDDDDDD